MAYLFFQTWVWLLLAFIIGLLLGGLICWLCCGNKSNANNHQTMPQTPAQPQAFTSEIAETSQAAVKTIFFSEPPTEVDDLKRIKGIGAVLEKTLHGLGIYQFKQIAGFSEEDISSVNESLSFPGRIEREDWVNQAKKLSTGIQTEFSKRVDHGDIDY